MIANKRFASCFAALAASLFGLTSSEVAHAGQVQIGPDFGFIARSAQSNGAGIAYEPGFVYGVHAQVLAAPWMRFSVYYLRADQPLTIPTGALRANTVAPDDLHVGSYVLCARLQPTLNLGSRFHLWANAGAGWGTITAPAFELKEGSTTMRVGSRSGVLVEVPVGLGGSFDIIERWLSVSLDATYAFLLEQSGDMYRDAQVVDSEGSMLHVGPMPKLGPAMTATLSLLIEL